MYAIAAMSRNGVIGNGGEIPWRIPEEFRWFRRMTINHVVIMGRKTFESLEKPLTGRINVVLTRHPAKLLKDRNLHPYLREASVGAAAHTLRDVVQLNLSSTPRTEVRLARGMDTLKRAGVTANAWLCGGAQVYEQFLPDCSELYLSMIERSVEGDAWFPRFLHLFDLAEVVFKHPQFRVLRYVNKELAKAAVDPSTGRASVGARPLDC